MITSFRPETNENIGPRSLLGLDLSSPFAGDSPVGFDESNPYE
jgi:hypothetical protein